MQRPRVPLPGERLSGVWTPRKRHQPSWRAKASPRAILWRLLPLVVVAIAIAGGILVWRFTATPVTVVNNGQPVELRSHRRTVAGAVRAAGVHIDDAIYLDPPADTPLESGMTITVAHRRPVIVHVDGRTEIGSSHELDPRAIVADLGIDLGPGDDVRVVRAVRPTPAEVAANPALDAIPALPREIQIVRATRIIVNQGGERVAFDTSARTLGEALTQAGYRIYESDLISHPLSAAIDELAADAGPGGVEIMLEQAIPVTVQDEGAIINVRTHQRQVRDLLNELGLALVGADYVLPGLDAPLTSGQTVQVVRVREEVVIEESPLPFETVYVPDPDLELDQQRIVRRGREGTLARQVRVRYENGVEVSRALEGEWVDEQPDPQVVAYGTKIVLRPLETPDGTFWYWRKLRVLATSYSPLTAGDKKPGDPRFGLSGTGTEVVRGVIAVDPRVISLYTHMYVPGYGTGQALDVGGAVKGMRVDLGYADEFLVQWNNWVDIYLLPPVPPPDQMIWRLPDS